MKFKIFFLNLRHTKFDFLRLKLGVISTPKTAHNQLKQIKAWVITEFSEFLKGGGITLSIFKISHD